MLVFVALSIWFWGEGIDMERKTELRYSMHGRLQLYRSASMVCGAIFGVARTVSGQEVSVRGNLGGNLTQKRPFSPIFLTPDFGASRPCGSCQRIFAFHLSPFSAISSRSLQTLLVDKLASKE